MKEATGLIFCLLISSLLGSLFVMISTIPGLLVWVRQSSVIKRVSTGYCDLQTLIFVSPPGSLSVLTSTIPGLPHSYLCVLFVISIKKSTGCDL